MKVKREETHSRESKDGRKQEMRLLNVGNVQKKRGIIVFIINYDIILIQPIST